MTIKYSQLTLAESSNECQYLLVSDTPTFFSLLEEHIDLNEFIPVEFYYAFHLSLGRKRDYPLKVFLSALILQKILTIPTYSLLIILLSLCRELPSSFNTIFKLYQNVISNSTTLHKMHTFLSKLHLTNNFLQPFYISD